MTAGPEAAREKGVSASQDRQQLHRDLETIGGLYTHQARESYVAAHAGVGMSSTLMVALSAVAVLLAGITALLRQDTALVARLIRMANSAVYGRAEPAGSIEEALACIGFREVTAPRRPTKVRVAVLDSGVEVAHPDLRGVRITYDHGPMVARDLEGHGTHVCGIISAIAAQRTGATGIADKPSRRAFRSSDRMFLA